LTESAIALVKPEQLLIARQVFGEDRIEVLKDQIARGATDAELELFAMVCQRTRLDPFARQIWFYRRRDKDPPIIQASIDGLRLIAERSGRYAGQRGPEWCGKDGRWRDLWLDAGSPAAARVGILRHGFPEPLWSVAVWERAKQTYWVNDERSRQRVERLMPLWERYGPEMLAKTAEAHGLKRAFPQETSGLEIADVPSLEDEDSARARQERNAKRYDEIFGKEEEEQDGRRRVDRSTGEVLEEEPADADAIEAALERNDRLGREAQELHIPGLRPHKAASNWSLEKITAANSELEERIRSRNSDLDQQAMAQSNQQSFT
jgi:HPt (histidine-containing phosphotransfer) domain-containing protein